MSWRPWVLLALFLAMVIANGALMFLEETRPPEQGLGPVDRVVDELVATTYGPGRRNDNFEAFGLPSDLRSDAFSMASRVYDEHPRLRALLEQDATVASAHLCANRIVPERYAAMGLLVEEKDAGGGLKEYKVIDWRRVTQFETQDWYVTSLVPDVYEKLELAQTNRDDSTVMGVAAILTDREDDVMQGNRPFANTVGGWSFRALRRNHGDLDAKLVEYFAVMHVLVELARDPDSGICSSSD